MISELISLGDILQQSDALAWDHAVYLAPGHLSAEIAGIVVDPMEAEGDDELPPVATANGLRYVITVQQLQDVVAHAREQKVDASPHDLVRALAFFLEHDAYIRF